jgi:hypothetical protein
VKVQVECFDQVSISDRERPDQAAGSREGVETERQGTVKSQDFPPGSYVPLPRASVCPSADPCPDPMGHVPEQAAGEATEVGPSRPR